MTSTFPWRIEGVLARGGMAELLYARAEDGTPVVVKRVLPHLVDEQRFLELFAREARISMRLVHPNVVRVLRTGEHEGLPYIAMEWLDGLDLRCLLGRTRLAPGLACAVAAAIARGLHHAHTLADSSGKPLGVVHRDVSPHNVVLTRAGEVKLIDFGIARSVLALDPTRTGRARGKIAYMAPEQLASLRVDARADIFALGVVLWEMLTARRLFHRETDTGTARAVRDESALPPSRTAHGLPPELDALTMEMLAKFAASRPRSAEIVAKRLEATAQSLGITDARSEVAALVARAV